MTVRRGQRWHVCTAPVGGGDLLRWLEAFLGSAGKVVTADGLRWFIELPGNLSGLTPAEDADLLAARKAERLSQDASRWFEVAVRPGGYDVTVRGSADAFTRAIARGMVEALGREEVSRGG